MDGQMKRDRQKERDIWKRKDKQTNDHMNGWTDEERQIERKKEKKWKRKDKQTNNRMNGWTDEERQIERKRKCGKERQADK